jgi:glycosyltransferase involved in cell wall biosynthesis
VEEKGCSLSLSLLELLLGEGINASLTIMETPRVFDISDRATTYAEKMKRLIPGLDLGPRLRLITASIIEMRAVYEASDIVLCPSIFPEPYGLAALEAMSCQRPVVASAAGGLPANIRHGQTGLLFRPGHLHDLHILAKELIRRPDFARNIGENARKYVVQERSIHHFARDMLNLYSRHFVRKG